MPASERITERTGLLINELIEKEAAKEQQEFVRSFEYIYSHPWRALILKTLLPSSVFNRWVMDKNVYNIFSQYSKLGFNKKLKNALAQYAAPYFFNEEECNFLKSLTYNPALNDLASCETLYRIANKDQLSFSDCKDLHNIAEKLATIGKNNIPLKAIIDNTQLAADVVDALTVIINKYTPLTDSEHDLLLNLSKKDSISKDEQNQLAKLLKNLNLNKQEHNLLNTVVTKAGHFFTKKITLTAQEQQALLALANKPRLAQVDYENLENFTQSIATESAYTIANREKIQEFASLQHFKKADSKALYRLATLSSYSLDKSKQLKTIALNPALTLSDHQLLIDITTKKQLTDKSTAKLAKFANDNDLNSVTKRQLESIISSAKNFKLSADFKPHQFFEDALIRYFIEDLQFKYQGTAETRYLNHRERQILKKMFDGLDPLSTEAKLLEQFTHKRYLSAKDSKQLETIIRNPSLTLDDYNELKALASKTKLNDLDMSTLQEIIKNNPQLIEQLAIITNKYKNRSFILSDEARNALIEAAENSALSLATREKLKTIIENKQLSSAARNFLRNIKINLNRMSDEYGFESRLTWLKGERNYTELVLNENRRAGLQDKLTRKVYDDLSELEQFIYTQDLHRLKLQGKLAEKAKAEMAARIKQRQYKEIIHDAGKVTTGVFAIVSGFMAFVATATAFAFIPPVGIPLAILVGIGTTITCNQLNQSNLSTLLIDVFVKRNLFEHLSGKQKLLLLILGIGCALAGIGAGILFYSLITAHLVAVLALVGIACPPLIPIIIGLGLAPLIAIMVGVTYFNTIREIIEHYSLNSFFNFLYKNFIQDVIDAESISERVAHIAKGICLIAFGLGGIILAGAAAVVAAMVLHEAAEPLLHSIIHAVIHVGHGISLHFVPAIKTLFLAVPAIVSSIRFLATSEHFGNLTTTIANFVKKTTVKLLQPLQGCFTPQKLTTQNSSLAVPPIAKPSLFEKVKNFFTQLPTKIEQAKDNPWSLAKPVDLVKKVAASGLIVLNGIGEGAVPEVVMNTTAEMFEAAEETIASVTSVAVTVEELLDKKLPEKSSEIGHKRVNAMRHSDFRGSLFNGHNSKRNADISGYEQISPSDDFQSTIQLTI
jgi:hypothetical protein